MSDYELRERRYGWQKFTHWLRTPPGILAVVGLIAVVIFGWQAPKIYRAAKVWRVTQLLADAEDARQRGDEATEIRRIQEAYSLLPAYAPTLRVQAHRYERRGEATALIVYYQLLDNKEATPDDATKACRLATLRSSPETAKDVLERAEKIAGAHDVPAVLALRARIQAADKRWEDALALARTASTRSGARPEKLVLAVTLLESEAPVSEAERMSMTEEAVALLAELATTSDDTALDALRALVSLANQPAVVKAFQGYDIRAWVEAAERHPKASARLRVLAWNLQLASQREQQESVFAAFLEKWRQSPLTERLEAARWLIQNGRPGLSLEISAPEKETSADWFLVHFDGLTATKEWAAALEQLDAESGQAAAMSAALRSLFRLTAEAQLGKPVNGEQSWREIRILLQSEPVRTQLLVAQHAEKAGESKQAAMIFRQVLDVTTTASSLDRNQNREWKFACYTGLLRCLPPSEPLAEVLKIAAGFASDFPEIVEARHNLLYLRVLSGEADHVSRGEIFALLQRSPSTPGFRAMAALLELQSGDPIAADKFYTDVKIDWNLASDRCKTVRAAVLAAVGRPEDALQLRAKINESNLRPEELALLP